MKEKSFQFKKITNEPYLPVINYRLGDFAKFKKAMINNINTKNSLKRWTNRDNSDWGIVLLDLWAYIEDILCYYQERIFNEALVRTSVLDESVINLMYGINYKPIQGTAASSVLFLEANEETLGTIPKNFRVQSNVSGGNGTLEFVTEEEITITDDVNMMKLSDHMTASDLLKGTTGITLDRSYDELEVGDFLLISDGADDQIVQIETKQDDDNYTTIKWSTESGLTKDYNIKETHIFKFTKTVRPFGYDISSKTSGVIRGAIYEQTRSLKGDENDPMPLSNATLELLDAVGDKVIRSDQTDRFGSFVFLNVYPGNYKLRLKRIDDVDVPRRWDKVDSTSFNLAPSNELVLDVLADSLELINDLGIDMRQKITASIKSSQNTNYMQRQILSSTIYLDNEYPPLKANSFLILIDERRNSLNLPPEIYRIREAGSEYHAQFGMKKTVNKLSLNNFDDSELLDFAFRWDSIPFSKENEKYTLKSKFKKYLMKKIRSKTEEMHEEVTSQAQDATGSMLKDAQSVVPESISDVTTVLSDEAAQKVSEKIENKVESQKEKFEENVSKVFGSKEKQITDKEKLGIEKLRLFLKEKLSLDWIDDVFDEDIIKPRSEDVIGISTDEHFLLFNLDQKNSKVQLSLDDQRTFDLTLHNNGDALDVYWDELYDKQFSLLSTKILTRSTFEIKTKPDIPSLKKTLKENQLILEGHHTSLEPGSRLLITDNTSSLFGQLMNSEMIPLRNYKIRLYASSDETSFLERLKTKKFQQTTNENGRFSFEDLHSGYYKLAAYLPIPAYWSLFLNNVIRADDILITQKTIKTVIQNSTEPIERTIITSSKIIENLLNFIYETLIDTTKSDNVEDSIKHYFLELPEKFNYAKKYSASLNDAVKNLLFFQTNENEKRIIEIFDTMSRTIIPKLERSLIAIFDDAKTILNLLSQRSTQNKYPVLLVLNRTIISTKIIREALRLITLTITKSTVKEDRNECRIGGASKFLLDPDTLVNIHLTSDMGGTLSYSKNKGKLRSPEIIRVSNISFRYGKTFLTLDSPLQNSYVRGYAKVNANLVPVSFGQIVKDEILGSGNSDLSSQQFTLKTGPLTYTASHTDPSGIHSTLEIFVENVKWHEKDDFFMSRPSDRHYVTSVGEDGITVITFGDGMRGSRVPSGVDNIRANYRVGLGAKGNLAQNTITIPVDTHPSIKSITNPVVATGGYQKNPVEEKSKLYSYVNSLGNAVTLQDYADLAKTATYVAKTRSFQVIEEGIPSIKLVIAPLGGLPLDSIQKNRLRRFLDERRDTSIPLKIISFKPVPIDLVMNIHVKDDYDQTEVVTLLTSSLRPSSEPGNPSLFSFEEMDFGTSISLSDVYDVIGNIDGIKYSVIKRFRRRNSKNEIEDRISVADDEIIQCEDDPLDTSKGTIRIVASGGIRGS